jgi:hypothetical protein
MIPRIRKRITYSNVIASLALFIALGGAAVAAGLPKNSVGPKQLKKNAVTAAKIKKGAVNGAKIAHGAVTAGKLAAGSVSSGALRNSAVVAAKLAKNSVTNAAIQNGVVGTNKLGNAVVTTVKLADKSVTTAKLADEVGPLVGTLKSGQTLRGVIYASGTDPDGTGTIASTAVSYQFPLFTAPATNIVDPNTATTGACPGITGGAGQTPQAAAGNLCVYITGKSNADTPTFTGATNRLGFAIQTKSSAEGDFSVTGQWAVTAP